MSKEKEFIAVDMPNRMTYIGYLTKDKHKNEYLEEVIIVQTINHTNLEESPGYLFDPQKRYREEYKRIKEQKYTIGDKITKFHSMPLNRYQALAVWQL